MFQDFNDLNFKIDDLIIEHILVNVQIGMLYVNCISILG